MRTISSVIKITLSVLLAISLVGCGKVKEAANSVGSFAQDVGNEIADTTNNVGNGVSEFASEAGENIKNYVSNIDTDKFKQGWEVVSDYVGTTYATISASDYVDDIVKAIGKLKTDINSSANNARGIAQEAGFAAEKWASDTFNINAKVQGSSNSTSVPNSNELASVDIKTSWGEDYSSKFYYNAKASAREQARTWWEKYNKYVADTQKDGKEAMGIEEWMNKNTSFKEIDKIYDAIYAGQKRLIPSDQMDEAVKYLELKAAKQEMSDSINQNVLSKSTRETLDNLADRITSPDGIESIPLTKEEAKAITELGKAGKYDPSDFGISVSQLVQPKYMLKQAMGAGATGAMIKVVLETAPQVYSIIADSIENRKIDENIVKDLGITTLLSGSEGFIEGSVSNLLLQMCKLGKFGDKLSNASPNVVASLTILMIDAIKYGYSLSKGEINSDDYGNLIAQEILVMTVSGLAGTAFATVAPGLPLVYMAGSMVGGIIATAGFEKTKELIFEVQDGGGFAAIIPSGLANSVDSIKNEIKNLNFSEKISGAKNFMISTISEGKIKLGLS